MDAQQLYRAGKLTEAISALSATLRDNPSDLKSRTFLFELLCFAGEFDRAEKQLDLLEQSGKKDSIIGTLLYRGALNAARTRQDMFEKKSYPAVAAQADQIRGKLNGREFNSIADADTRIGSKLEVFAAGDYLWLSFRDIAAIEIEPPKRLRDLLWVPAKLQTGPNFRSRDLGEVLLPAISPLSWQHPDDIVRLGRTTEWCEDESGEISPFGQKMLLVDGEEFPFLELRHLEIDAGIAAPA
ncbi:MAG TPA: type VI secretion system accessory protein TagJ [Bryobacteraceae bacterium]|nr:type VI secretion system accessory protein TagJ [Bryobacteraceae bacterium]